MVVNLEKLIEACKWRPDVDLPYKEYYFKTNLANKIVLSRLSEFLEPLDNDAIATVGSDARLEKGYASQIELVILLSEDSNKEVYQKISEKLPPVIHPFFEFKYKDSKSYLYNDIKNRIFPSRIIDLNFITGNYDRFVYEKSKLIYEINEDHKKIKQVLRNRKRYYSKILSDGSAKFKGNILKHYDLKEGIVYFDNKTRWGLKAGPLRTIQVDIVYRLYKTIHETQDLEFFLSIPKTTVERIYIFTSKDFPLIEAEELANNYMFFLKEYHKQQKVFHDFSKKMNSRNIIVNTVYDPNNWQEIKERIESIKTILKLKEN
ncbi:MAG: hypothetical protein PWP03_217 [Candidatus Woesearchaeota archaeon]|nr:hypothetical protein [Candidatus Woesearchaeota archaeon]